MPEEHLPALEEGQIAGLPDEGLELETATTPEEPELQPEGNGGDNGHENATTDQYQPKKDRKLGRLVGGGALVLGSFGAGAGIAHVATTDTLTDPSNKQNTTENYHEHQAEQATERDRRDAEWVREVAADSEYVLSPERTERLTDELLLTVDTVIQAYNQGELDPDDVSVYDDVGGHGGEQLRVRVPNVPDTTIGDENYDDEVLIRIPISTQPDGKVVANLSADAGYNGEFEVQLSLHLGSPSFRMVIGDAGIPLIDAQGFYESSTYRGPVHSVIGLNEYGVLIGRGTEYDGYDREDDNIPSPQAIDNRVVEALNGITDQLTAA